MSRLATRILLVDDAQIECLAFERQLHKIPFHRLQLDWVSTYADALVAFDRDQHDLYFVDFRLGPDNGLDLVRRARVNGMTKPIIVLTGHGSAAVDKAATDAGANDYLVKGEFDAVLLERSIRYASRNADALAEVGRRLVESRATARELMEQTKRRAAAEADVLQVLRQTMTDQEAERQRIAREMHDNLGQSVTLVQLGLDSIARSASAQSDIASKAASLKRITHDMSRSLHRIAWEVRPTALDALGLEDAIGQLVAEWEPHCSLCFDLHFGLGDRRLPPDVESALYRVIQEGITNVVRHAKATRVGVILEMRGNELICIVEDDGCGVPEVESGVAEKTSRRLGLLGMRERLALVNGTVELESHPEKGTAVFARVPL
ncbi:response regulator receiver sensor signal transduction histidine kinase [Rhodopseudomonas palustris HaA2]|uniref:histidine kinase n=1 Tax=Rhodopseudomonas palustris (strain HaA2) TaxID=316058 RepID=Q2IRM4_RHOP2|nr:ATP-binding protein [Rhodopseudomonas palustris]ABD09136.1 response regulator receiver sensor signal transduction histidine kinase [Rhodopseudomonas palustris HaA2]